jgi:hypothetical protein
MIGNCIVGRHREVDLVHFDCTLFIVIVVLLCAVSPVPRRLSPTPYTDPEVDLRGSKMQPSALLGGRFVSNYG